MQKDLDRHIEEKKGGKVKAQVRQAANAKSECTKRKNVHTVTFRPMC